MCLPVPLPYKRPEHKGLCGVSQQPSLPGTAPGPLWSTWWPSKAAQMVKPQQDKFWKRRAENTHPSLEGGKDSSRRWYLSYTEGIPDQRTHAVNGWPAKTYRTALGTLLNVMWQPGWEGVWERMDTRTCLAESLCCSTETITLLISYTPIHNKKVFFF